MAVFALGGAALALADPDWGDGRATHASIGFAGLALWILAGSVAGLGQWTRRRARAKGACEVIVQPAAANKERGASRAVGRSNKRKLAFAGRRG